MFLAGYVGLALPVVGLGVLTLRVPPRTGLLVFTVTLATVAAAATPKVLAAARATAEVVNTHDY